MMRTLYHAAMYDESRPVSSYWESTADTSQDGFEALAGEASCDVAVIGAGYTGASTALHLARDHGVDVRVLEAGHAGWGAPARNGGFCCIPAAKMSIPAMLRRYGEDQTRRFFAAQVAGVERVRALAASEDVDYEHAGDGNL